MGHDERQHGVDAFECLGQTRRVQKVHFDPSGPLYGQFRGGILGIWFELMDSCETAPITYLASEEDDFMLSGGEQSVDDLVGDL